MKDVVAEP